MYFLPSSTTSLSFRTFCSIYMIAHNFLYVYKLSINWHSGLELSCSSCYGYDICIISLSPFSSSGGHRLKSVFPKSRTAKRPETPVATDIWISGSKSLILPPGLFPKIFHYKSKPCRMIIYINHSAGFLMLCSRRIIFI